MLRLRIDEARWRAGIATVAAGYGPDVPVVPVVKGNGYGFGRAVLAAIAVELLAGQDARVPATIAVGTVHELDGLPAGARPLVLTPAPAGSSGLPTGRSDVVVTVGAVADVEALAGWAGPAVVKLESSMHRFGARVDEVAGLVDAALGAGLSLEGFGLHLPVAGPDEGRRAEVEVWIDALDALDRRGPVPRVLWLSHLAPATLAAISTAHPGWLLPIRLGTSLWHGDKAALRLSADVAVTRPVGAGEPAGYHATPAPGRGMLVIVGAGSAHGVVALEDGRSPFHYGRRRLALLERPHMHTSTVFVPDGEPCPRVGDAVDVQRPLSSVLADELAWRRARECDAAAPGASHRARRPAARRTATAAGIAG